MSNATPNTQPPTVQPLAVWNPTRGIWEKPQLDLFGQQEQFWETWPTSGMTRNGSVYPLPTSAHPTPDTASSSSPTALFRTPLASDAARGGESLQQVKARRGTIALSHQVVDLVTRPDRWPTLEMTFGLIEEFFTAGDDTLQQSFDGKASPVEQPHLPRS